MMSKYATIEDCKASKKVVHYSELWSCEVGKSAVVIPVDHTNHKLGQYAVNGEVCDTSIVQSYDQSTGVLETKNTIYKPISMKE